MEDLKESTAENTVEETKEVETAGAVEEIKFDLENPEIKALIDAEANKKAKEIATKNIVKAKQKIKDKVVNEDNALIETLKKELDEVKKTIQQKEAEETTSSIKKDLLNQNDIDVEKTKKYLNRINLAKLEKEELDNLKQEIKEMFSIQPKVKNASLNVSNTNNKDIDRKEMLKDFAKSLGINTRMFKK